jgi:hypothetical protein
MVSCQQVSDGLQIRIFHRKRFLIRNRDRLVERQVKKNISFDRFIGDQWPPLDQLEPFFLAPNGQEWSYLGGNDSK